MKSKWREFGVQPAGQGLDKTGLCLEYPIDHGAVKALTIHVIEYEAFKKVSDLLHEAQHRITQLESSPRLPQGLNQESKTINQLEFEAIDRALKMNQGHVQRAAKSLGISRTSLYRKIKEYNINLDFKC